MRCIENGVEVAVEFPRVDHGRPLHHFGYPGCTLREGAESDGPIDLSKVESLLPKRLFAWSDLTVEEVDDEARRKASDALDAIGAVVTRLMDALRSRQMWMGLSGAPPHLLEAQLVLLETGESLQFTRVAEHGKRATIVHDEFLTLEQAQQAVEGATPEPYERLIADGLYLVLHAPHPSPAHGVLLVAVGCETWAKALLVSRANDSVAPLVEWMLRSHRSIQVSAHDLFDDLPRLILSHSLKMDDPTLFTAVRRLFEARNRIAHRADLLDLDEARGHARTGYSVAQWLRRLESDLEPAAAR